MRNLKGYARFKSYAIMKNTYISKNPQEYAFYIFMFGGSGAQKGWEPLFFIKVLIQTVKDIKERQCRWPSLFDQGLALHSFEIEF